MEEIVLNTHMHTLYSDGTGTHQDIARAAIQAGLDAVIVTDHNILVPHKEGYYTENKKRLLMLIGEEIHDQGRDPQKSHLLVFGAGRELATYAHDPQRLIQAVQQAGGICFLAHPYESAVPAFGETDIGWDDWQVRGFTGLELWNGLSEFKSVYKNLLQALFLVFFPQFVAEGPHPKTLQKWDELLNQNERVFGICGSDAHNLKMHLGPFSRHLFPYEFHFSAQNNHLLLPEPLNGELEHDRKLILDCLRAGRLFVGYDLPAPTRGFRFRAQGRAATAEMGEEIEAEGGVTLNIRPPDQHCEVRLLRNGEIIERWSNRAACAHITTTPGVYRVEVRRRYLGMLRGWIFSNPIFVR